MKTYHQIHEGKIYRYYYDYYIRLWTIYEIDEYGYQLDDYAPDYEANKKILLERFPFLTFKSNFECLEKLDEDVNNEIIILKSVGY